MSDELYNELIAKGYLPELRFRNDAYTKLLYVKNFNDGDLRISKKGQFNVPTFPLLEQNETLKAIAGGTRVHLGPTDEDPGEGPWSCTGNVTNTLTLESGYSEATRYFRITVSHPNDSRTYECSGSGFLGAVLLSNSSFAMYLDRCNIKLNWDSGQGNYFYNQDEVTDYQIEILEVTAAGVPRESDIYWPEQENTSFVYVPNYAVRFCLAHKQQVLPVISCADASTNISFRFNIFNIDEFFVDGVSYGDDWSLMWRDDYLKTIFNADYDNTGYVRNESTEPHRILIMGSDLNFEDIGDPNNLSLTYDEAGEWVGFCLAEQQVIAPDITWDFEYKLSTASTPTKIKLGSATSGVNITNTATTNIDKATIEWVHVNSTVSDIGSGTFRVGIPPSVATELVLPTSLRTIGSQCFEYWTACTELTIPEGVTDIGQYAFRGWSSVLHVTIPSTLNVMQTRAFAGWSSCLTITCTALQPPTYSAFDTDPFQGLSAAARIYVPADSVAAYKAALGWSQYASIILPIT